MQLLIIRPWWSTVLSDGDQQRCSLIRDQRFQFYIKRFGERVLLPPLYAHLTLVVPPANGGTLNILGRANITVEVAGLKSDFPFLVAEKLTQECILGADFLQQHKCIIDLSKQTLKAGGASTNIESGSNAPTSICHVTFLETTVLPGNSEVELPLQLSKLYLSGTAILEPAPKLMERYGILIAHSLTYTGPRTGGSWTAGFCSKRR